MTKGYGTVLECEWVAMETNIILTEKADTL